MIGILKSGESVADRSDGSHIHESVKPYIVEALASIDAEQKDFLVEEVNFGKEIGKSVCVVTEMHDQIIFAQRPNRFGHTRFVIGKEPEPCSSVVVILKLTEEQGYVLLTAFIGRKAEPEPWDRNATEKSAEFWSTRALVWGSEPIIPGTETFECPWNLRK